jgi:regulator of sigma E protease
LLSWRRTTEEGDEIEFVVAVIPLGGYVKMLDEREGEVAENELQRAFNNQHVAKRIAIVFAGPAFNFILAMVLYWFVFMMGTTMDRPFIGEMDAGSIAADAGFEVQDEVLMVGNSKVQSWNEFRLEILDQGMDGGTVQVLVQTVDGIERMRELDLQGAHLLENEGDIFEFIGFTQWLPELPAEIGGVLENSAAEKAGLQQGDVVMKVGSVDIVNWTSLVDVVRANPETALTFLVMRDGIEQRIAVMTGVRETGEGQQGLIGAYQHIPEDVLEQLVTHVEYTPTEAISRAIIKTWDMSTLTLRVLWKMIVGEASLANISGPITIATYAGVTASIGLVSFLSFLAVISVSLGVLNLLPVPMLDGGHLLYYFIEIIKGSPVSEAFELRGQQIGIVILAMLMTVAIFNDIQRLIQ